MTNAPVFFGFLDVMARRVSEGNGATRLKTHEVIVDDYPALADADERGYDVALRDNMLEIQGIDEIGKFERDEAAVEQAVKDGIPLIPVEELPADFQYRWFGWVDTPKNRAAIAEDAQKWPAKKEE